MKGIQAAGGEGYALGREAFLRGMGVVYALAFASLWVQVSGLFGSEGVLPVEDFLRRAAENTGEGWRRFVAVPSVFWLSAGDAMLHAVCGAGVLAGLVLTLGLLPWIGAAVAWLAYLSLASVGQDFLSFQWDALLLEAGFLAILWSPLRLRLSGARARPAPAIPRLLVRLLIFRLLFASGVVKLASGDPSWQDLTALTFHYETQPLPTWLGWYVHQAPVWFHRASCGAMFAVELVVPWLFFAPRRVRLIAAFATAGFMLAIALSGNYGFFNLLTVVLCLPLLDDRFWRRGRDAPAAAPPARRDARWWAGQALLGAVAAPIVLLSLWLLVFASFRVDPGAGATAPVFAAGQRLYALVQPLRLVNSYGLFARMTKTRPEITIEGSRDGETFTPYRFRWKPGALEERPRFAGPHMPRLDWQLWFAALRAEAVLERYPDRPGLAFAVPWFQRFLQRLGEPSPAVVSLLAEPAPVDAAPAFLRVSLYLYRFTGLRGEDRGEAWWRREGPVATVTFRAP